MSPLPTGTRFPSERWAITCGADFPTCTWPGNVSEMWIRRRFVRNSFEFTISYRIIDMSHLLKLLVVLLIILFVEVRGDTSFEELRIKVVLNLGP
ncbi:hypothetical protein Y032_0117g698 [Ancylostoma ceylanicum]|uniref:Uncharacterized protein n=1 Tax=Ancylostoma ceylanicum TaxID=53326 RepID=A0A016TC93_9BILA|nr:hypothetical protein Y032_0117g698 [Ancylostoma ceylanicum]